MAQAGSVSGQMAAPIHKVQPTTATPRAESLHPWEQPLLSFMGPYQGTWSQHEPRPLQLKAVPGMIRPWTDFEARPLAPAAAGPMMGSWHNYEARPLQRMGLGPVPVSDPFDVARAGASGAASALPHLSTIQKSFGGYDVTDVRAHTGDQATRATQALAARGYATGDDVVFSGTPDLHTAAHEATHVLQQRAGLSPSGGMGKEGDHFEQHADRVADTVVAGESASATLAELIDPSYLAMAQAVQLDGVDLDVLKSGANITWDYIKNLMKQLNVAEAVSTLVDKLCNWFVSQIGVPASLQAYLDMIAPWVSIADAVISVIEAIPETIRTAILYVLGFGIRKFSTTCLKGKITETHIHGVLTTGSDFGAKLAGVVHFLKNVVTSPTGALYSLFSSGILGGLSSYLFGGGGGSEQDGATEEDVKPKESEEGPAPLIDANVGFFWINAQAPKLATWTDRREQRERAGMEMDARLGFKLFDNVIGTDNLKFHLPYGGDWETTLTDVTLLEDEIGINGVLKASGIGASKVRFNQKGLQFINITVDSVTLGDDVVKSEKIHMSWAAGKDELIMGGTAAINVLSKTFNTRMTLAMTKEGGFKSGSLDVKMLDTIDVVPGKLQVINPQFSGAFAKGKAPDVALQGDVKLNLLEQLTLASQAVKLAYKDGAFEGSVALLSITLALGDNSRAIFEIKNGVVNKTGFQAEQVKLTYAYDATPQVTAPSSTPSDSGGSTPEHSGPTPGANTLSKSQLPSLLPGFNMDWIKNAGLQTLVISGSAASVRLGATGLEVGAVERSVDKFSGKLFGVGAEFDGTAGTGAITGDASIKPPMPSLNLVFWPVPGIEVGLGISTDLSLAANLRGELAKQAKEKGSTFTPWQLGGSAGIKATAGVEAKVSADLGTQFIASIGAEIFGRAEADVDATAALSGKILYDEAANDLKLSDKPTDAVKATYDVGAKLTASLGARLRARFFYFYEKKLYEYRFKEWILGQWRTQGTIFSTRDGETHVEPGPQTFDGQKNPVLPKAQVKLVPATEVIDDLSTRGDKISDKLLLQRLVYDIAEISLDIPNKKRQELFEKIRGFAADPTVVDTIGLEKLRFMNARSATGTSPSLIMTREEWEKYSTTEGLLFTNSRETVVPIDQAIAAYHRAEGVDARITALGLLKQAVETYLSTSTSHRVPMVTRLAGDIEKEKEQLDALKAQEEQDD